MKRRATPARVILRSKMMSQVLIVDDSRTNLALLSHLTQRVNDHIVVEAKDHADKALHWLTDNTPDLIIADYNMPDINGIEFTRHCRAVPNGKDVPIVMVTSARRRKVCLEALRAGATEFLNSPVNQDDFITRVGHLLQLRRKSQDVRERAQEYKQTRRWSRQQGLLPGTPEWLKLVHVLDNVPVMLSAVSPMGQCLFVNAMQSAFFDCDPAEITGKYLTDLPTHIRDHLDSEIDAKVLASQQAVNEFEQELMDNTGTHHVLLTTKKPLYDDHKNIIAVLTTSVDITARKKAEDNLLHVAEHDSLTELPNRLSLRQHMERNISNATQQSMPFALLFIDVDRFKDINDSLGHEFGDRLLSTIAGRLDKSIAKPNFVARLGGDEFAVVISNTDSHSEISTQAQTICEQLRAPIFLGNHEIRISASIGIACYPHHGTTVDELLSRADLAMYRAKADGGNGFHTANRRDHERACRNACLESDLRRAISQDQLRLYYQPKIRLSDRKLIGAEALIRWQHPDRGLVSPAEFLPLAEDSGLILPIGDWVVHKACHDAGLWSQGGHQDLSVSVNISPSQFAKQIISELAASALRASHLSPDRLVIELTEQSIMRNTQTLRQDLDALREMGIKLSLDDFGTGYASLRYVQNFPLTELKIDRSFVKNHTVDSNDLAIVNAIIGLGKTLNLDVVAEGVETLADAISLENAGCLFAQGYYFSPPVPVTAFNDILNERKMSLPIQNERCA